MPSTPETPQRSGSRHTDKPLVRSYDLTPHPPALGRVDDRSSPNERSHAAGRMAASSSKDLRVDDAISQSAPYSRLTDAPSSYVLYDEPDSRLSPPNTRGGTPPRSRSPIPNGPTQHFQASISHPSSGSTSDLKAMARSQSAPRPRPPMLAGISSTMRQQTQPNISSSSMHPSPSSRRPVNYSGNMPDSSGHGLSSRLDMKRLLSKPAAPSHSGSSIISVPSDTEPAPISPTHDKTPVSVNDKDGSPVSGSSDYGRGREAILKASSPMGQPHLTPRKRDASMPRPSSSRETSTGHRGEEMAPALRRKPSGSRPMPSSSPTTPMPALLVATSSHRRAVVPSLTIDPTYGNCPGSPADHSIGRAAGRRYHGASAVMAVAATKRREMNLSAPVTPIGLTPAGAVAHAYKQQEQKRSTLASMTTEESHHLKSRSLDDERKPSQEGSGEHSATPYYTVFGSTSGKVVAVGGPDDYDWMYTSTTVYAERPESRAGRPSSSLKRSLSRNMSTTFKKGKSTVKREVSPDASNPMHSTEAEKSTLLERRSASLPKERRKSLRLSIDDFSERRVMDPLLTGRSVSASRHQAAQQWGEWTTGSGGQTQDTHTPPKHNKLAKPRDAKKKEEDGSPAGKIWKLVKRISTGGLRERYASQDFSPPPVPALPKEYISQSPARSAEAIASPERGGLARFIQSRPSMAVSRSPVPSNTSPFEFSSRASIAGVRRGSNATSGNRPSTTTRSSSPVSSDRTSSRFFHRPHSAHSSSSSYGEEIPPMPSGKMPQHIIPPSELAKLNSETESPKGIFASNQDMSRMAAHDEVTSSLPCPPRRLGSAGKGSSRPTGSGAPMVPPLASSESFSAATLSHFSSQSSDGGTSTWTSPITPASGVPLSEFGVQPPPRPPKSAQRSHKGSASSSGSVPSPLSGTLGPSTLPSFTITPTDERDNPLDSEAESNMTRDRDSYGASSNASTMKGRPRSNSLGSDSPSRSGFMFREFGATPKQQWTEKEKAEKWDDLLERSARAGGTLHIGGEGLMSDNVRFSQYSEL
ncbi:hypothetical protein NEOLEDRAFT_1178633 [Neolentinus lepideus HHB14362 ss-1]|uniref:Uncharacterized protein n=1 Tax=Neolentinus lepideus HHB14362 ss-1 TaxID=1314782 RepID=A0A165SIS7_9AGAM|nr:hypothetical protein NEOLEDRAFT_1178633 [Neolentinus lepideus HHB14362 ss-1]